ncbi:hypothetical protein BDZ91DRAFT_795309 [Kalaharituber pfeilii]|nr:hypothetical protein BDZ91DRAFT_795309 [Kalaharituber pfeilii]
MFVGRPEQYQQLLVVWQLLVRLMVVLPFRQVQFYPLMMTQPSRVPSKSILLIQILWHKELEGQPQFHNGHVWPHLLSLAIHLPTPTLAALVAAYGPAIPAGRTIGEWWIKTRTFFKVEQDFHFSVVLWTLRNEAVVEVQAILNSAPAPPTPARRGHKRAAGGRGQGGSGNRDGGGSRGSRGGRGGRGGRGRGRGEGRGKGRVKGKR